MSGFRTLAPAVQAALLAALIAAAVAGADVVSLGYPAGGLAAEQVWVVGDFDSAIAWATTGWTQREEDGTAEVRVVRDADHARSSSSRRRGRSSSPACVEDALAADRTLGGVVDRCEVIAGQGPGGHPREEHQRPYGIILTVSWAGCATA